MSYKEYKQARDAAWKVIIECKVSELPVRPSAICRHYGWKLADYQSGSASIELMGLPELTKKTDGFCTITQRRVYIFSTSAFLQGVNASQLPMKLATWH